MIIDAEVHLIQPDVLTSWERLYQGEHFFQKVIYTHPEGECALKLATTEKLLESMEQNAIDRSLIMGLPWIEEKNNQKNNEFIAQAVREHPGKLYGLGLVDIANKEKTVENIKRFKEENGFLGIKVIPSWQSFRLDSEEFFYVVETLIKYDLVLFPHIDFVIKNSQTEGPQHLFNLIRKFPDLKVLAPHLGGLLCFHTVYEPFKEYFKNARFVTSITETMSLVKSAADVLDEHLLIFGTDYPFQPNHDQKTVIERFEELNIEEGLKNRIYKENFCEFFNLSN